MTCKQIPLVVLWDEVLFPSTSRSFMLERPYNIGACEIVRKSIADGGSSSILVVNVREPGNEESLTADSFLGVGVLCDLVDFVEVNDNGQKRANITLAGIRRVKFKNIERMKRWPGDPWVAEFQIMRGSIPKGTLHLIYKNGIGKLSDSIQADMKEGSEESLEAFIDQKADS